MNSRFFEKLELNKVLAQCAEFAVLSKSKEMICGSRPSDDISVVREQLKRTEEADRLLFKAGVSGIEYFDDVTDLVSRAAKGSILSCGELKQLNALNRSARIAYFFACGSPQVGTMQKNSSGMSASFLYSWTRPPGTRVQ